MVKRASSRFINPAERFLSTWAGWIVASIVLYVVGLYLVSLLLSVISHFGGFARFDATTFALITRVATYGTLIGLMIAIPVVLRQRITMREMGLDRVMTWKDIAVGSAGLIVYLLIATGVLALARLIPGIDLTQAQNLEIGQVFGAARMVVFVMLVVITPFAEELLFRGLFYGGLRSRKVPAWASALVVSALFGLAHGQLNVGIDVFCLSLVACYARELTGSIWAGVVLHMIKNFIAFALMFLVNQGMS